MLRYTHILWAWNTHGTGHCCQGVLNLFHYFNKKNKKIKKYINKTKKQQKKHMKGNCVKWNVIMNMENTGDGPRFANSITCSTNLTELFSSLQKCNISGFYKAQTISVTSYNLQFIPMPFLTRRKLTANSEFKLCISNWVKFLKMYYCIIITVKYTSLTTLYHINKWMIP